MAEPSPAVANVQKLFFEYAAALRGFVFGMLGDRDATNDVFQEVFLAVMQSADRFRPEQGGFPAWARGIARIKVLEHFRKSRRLPQLFDENILELLADSAGGQDADWADHRTALADCVRRLAPRARQILELRYAETPTSPPEIAQRLSWTVNAVHVALARARKFLHECTRRRLATAEG